MEAVKRLEIVTDFHEMREIIRLLEANGIAGYTVIKDVVGKGERGLQTGDELTDVFKNSYLLTTCHPDQLDALIRAIRPALKRRGGICLVSDALWVMH